MVALPPVLDGIQGDEAAVPRSQFFADGHWVDPPRLWDELDPEREVGGRQVWAHVQAVIAALPAGQRAVIILRDIEDRTAEEACALLQISAENQRVLLHRARGRVRRAIDELTGATEAVRSSSQRPAPGRRAGGLQAGGRKAGGLKAGGLRRMAGVVLAWMFAAGDGIQPPRKSRIAAL